MNEKESSEIKLPKGNLSKPDWRVLNFVMIAGSLGGLASLVYGLVLREPVPVGWLSIPTAIFLGAFAAGIGVYVLTNTDTSEFARTLFFAALCGFVWKPVCDAGKAFIQQTIQKQQDAAVEEAGSKTEALAKSLAATPLDQQPAKLEEIHESALAALDTLPQAQSLRAQRDAEAKVIAALKLVSQFAPKHPQVASRVIQSVGETAAARQAAKVSNLAVTCLAQLAETNKTFSVAHDQLGSNIASTVSGRYRLNLFIRPR